MQKGEIINMEGHSVAEDEVRGQLAMFAERRVAVEKMLDESALSNEAKARYLFRFHDRLRAIAQ